MPQLAAFPKAWMDELCLTGALSLRAWIEMAATLEIDGLEFYSGMLDLQAAREWPLYARIAADHGLRVPMLCCSPDFTHPDADFRRRQVEQEKRWIEMTATLGGSYCRVLSGQRRPEVSRADGVRFAVECIEACLPHAAAYGVVLTLENHYKDNYWQFPEFAQRGEVFCELVAAIASPHFGVNFDPSNALLAGEEPLELLEHVKTHVRTMHASDRFLSDGTLEDLRREEAVTGYVAQLQHGVIGGGLNDYDAIFATLSGAGFDNWISIEDGVDGLDQLRASVAFLRRKIARYWPA